MVFIRIERLLKEGVWKLFVPSVWKKYRRKYTQYSNNKNVYFLCVSAYAASDLAKIGCRGERVLQWAYCPEFDNQIVEKKEVHGKITILWAGRMIKWKHPEVAIKIAHKLKKKQIAFSMDMAGCGKLEKKVQRMIKRKKLENDVHMIGAIPASKMRQKMRDKDVFITTSDRNEGWGVVINEAMNSGCVVIASKAMGAAPVLIKNGENGFSFSIHKLNAIVSIIEKLSQDYTKMNDIRENAYNTIRLYYTPQIYAERFVQLAQDALSKTTRVYIGMGEKATLI